jgi:hypothetical protein
MHAQKQLSLPTREGTHFQPKLLCNSYQMCPYQYHYQPTSGAKPTPLLVSILYFRLFLVKGLYSTRYQSGFLSFMNVESDCANFLFQPRRLEHILRGYFGEGLR